LRMIFIKGVWGYIIDILAYISDLLSKLPFVGHTSHFNDTSCFLLFCFFKRFMVL
jgi:hypothetical protein